MSTAALPTPSHEAALRRYGLSPQYVPEGHDSATVTEVISAISLSRHRRPIWAALLLLNLGLLTIFGAVILYLLVTGVGI
jgi:hypothetical protein